MQPMMMGLAIDIDAASGTEKLVAGDHDVSDAAVVHSCCGSLQRC